MQTRTRLKLGSYSLITLAAGWLAARRLARPSPSQETMAHIGSETVESSSTPAAAHLTAAPSARLNRASALVAAATLADSAIEHYRGAFKNKAMYTPLLVSSLGIATAWHRAQDSRGDVSVTRTYSAAIAAVTGVVGTGFHIYNVAKRPDGFTWLNVFYGAPLGAPGAATVFGALSYAAEKLRAPALSQSTHAARVRRLGTVLAYATGASLIVTAAEAALLHFRGAYHRPEMYLPVTVPPITAALLAQAAWSQTPASLRRARTWLNATAAIGMAGSGFHIYGVHRNMGGWKNWRQTVLNGPPIPAPPSFTALALAGFAALTLMEEPAHV